jgi:hypothetical protein
MRRGILLLGVLLVLAPLSPLARTTSAGMSCCPLGKDATCCKNSSCSIRRCARPDTIFLAALPPGVLPPRVLSPPPAETGRIVPPGILPAALPAMDLPDPPPRA